MKNNKKYLSISLIVPTYNDEKTIVDQITFCERILKKFCKTYEIIIAEDHGSDRTEYLLKKNFLNRPGYTIVFNKKNLGITKNVRQLYFLAKKEFVFFYSADGDWNPGDIERMIVTLIETKADIVIGKRRKKIGYTFFRYLVSFFHKLLPILLFGVNTIDPGGIKIIRTKYAQIDLVSESQFFEAEMIIRAKLAGAVISWFPVTYKKIYYGSGHGGGFFPALHSVFDAFRLRLRLFFVP